MILDDIYDVYLKAVKASKPVIPALAYDPTDKVSPVWFDRLQAIRDAPPRPSKISINIDVWFDIMKNHFNSSAIRFSSKTFEYTVFGLDVTKLYEEEYVEAGFEIT